MPVQIAANGAQWRNDSEYVYDLGKLTTRPPSLEEMDGFRERLKSSETQTTRVYQCNWSERIAAYEWLVGYSNSVLVPETDPVKLAAAFEFNFDPTNENDSIPDDVAKVAQIKRVIPAQDPERPWLFADEVDLVNGAGAWVVSPFVYALVANANNPGIQKVLLEAIHYVNNNKGGTASFDGPDEESDEIDQAETLPSNEFDDGKAIFRVVFRPRDYSVLTDERMAATGGGELARYVRRTEEMAMEALPLAKLANAGKVLKFVDGPYAGSVIPEAGVQQFPLKNLTYEWVDVPDLPRGAHARCVGKINDGPFDGLRGSPEWPAETLLCLPWKFRQTTSVTGRINWQVQYRFVFRPQKWNYFAAGDGNFYRASFGGNYSDEWVYKKADFDDLFLPPPPKLYLG